MTLFIKMYFHKLQKSVDVEPDKCICNQILIIVDF